MYQEIDTGTISSEHMLGANKSTMLSMPVVPANSRVLLLEVGATTAVRAKVELWKVSAGGNFTCSRVAFIGPGHGNWLYSTMLETETPEDDEQEPFFLKFYNLDIVNSATAYAHFIYQVITDEDEQAA